MSDDEPETVIDSCDAETSAENHSEAVPNPRQIGRYRIERVLGRGGFGLVFLAYDEQLERPVAIKVPHGHLVATTESAEAYLAEARTVANLDHPGIVPVYDVGSTNDFPCFIVSKYVEGQTLGERMRRERLSATLTAEIVAVVARALHYAHQHGLVHRDVKPGNILLDTNLRPFLVDFGLALKEQNVGHGSAYAGTPAYMSPEQARGEGHRVDARSDVFSLGVVVYEIICGCRPFEGTTVAEVLRLITTTEPRPPRQRDDRIPREIDRICLKAMTKRATDRYASAAAMADDLQQFLDQKLSDQPAAPGRIVADFPDIASAREWSGTQQRIATAISASTDSIGRAIRIVPKGLRSFDAHDSDFFLELLPGPRDRDGLPDSLRFWKTRIEQTDEGDTFPVGLIYGPSGCGKSSLVKAGLLPRLSNDVICVYVEATSAETEARILSGLRKKCPALNGHPGLKASLAAIRQGQGISLHRKVLIVIDQFEQWLHANKDQAGSELVEALRQCDGGRVQCIVMVRDDFWMAATRFMRELEIRLIDGQNSAAVDLFDVPHAARVLAAFGRAFGRLSGSPGSLQAEEKEFVRQAVADLAQDGKVISVQLALFAEMMKGKPWTSATLKQVGGTAGLGAAYLEESFSAKTAHPEYCIHQQAARIVLQSLLPESGLDIKGHMRSSFQLLAASGYSRRPDAFEDLIRILDSEMRLITPTDPEGLQPTDDSQAHPAVSEKYYQLAHDYLVHSLRDWLTRKQRETRRGRAALRLRERAEMWHAHTERRQLPTLWEWLNIELLTRRREWNEPERRMLQAASQHYAVCGAIACVILFATVLVGMQIRQRVRDAETANAADALVESLVIAETSQVSGILERLSPWRERISARLAAFADDADVHSKKKLHASLALLPSDAGRAVFLREHSLVATPAELIIIRDALKKYQPSALKDIWQEVDSPRLTERQRFRAYCLLADIDPTHERWPATAKSLADQLVSESPMSFSLHFAEALRPVQVFLLPPLAAIFRDPSASETKRQVAANVLVDYASHDIDFLVSLAIDATPQQFAVILPALETNRSEAISRLRGHLNDELTPNWDDVFHPNWPEPTTENADAVEAADGMLTPKFAFCQTMPLSEFLLLANDLTPSGYRPVCFRPFATEDGVRVAATWVRDGLPWQIAHGKTVEELRAENESWRSMKYLPVDVAACPDATDASHVDRYAAVWVHGWKDVIDARMYVGVTDDKHGDEYWPLIAAGFTDRTNLRTWSSDQQELSSSVRWKLWYSPREDGSWTDSESSLRERLARGWMQADIRMTTSPDARDAPLFSAMWWNGAKEESRESHGLSPATHLTRCRELAAEDFRPGSISVISLQSGPIASSVWHRPFVAEQLRDQHAGHRANAAIALFRLDDPEPLWPLLTRQPDPRGRSCLIDRLSTFGLPPEAIFERLKREKDPGIRDALVLGLSNFQPAAMTPALRDAMVEWLLAGFETDADAGFHSAAELTLRRWGQSSKVLDVDLRCRGRSAGNRNWLTDSEGHTLVIVPGPVEFQMGSVPQTEARDNYEETLHRRRIDRSIAVASKEVTVEQFQRFQPDVNYSHNDSPEPTCPINAVDWFSAVQYCNWLSERANIPKDQWCYPIGPGEIKPEMKMPDDYLRRTGYRLPTEAEWEYLCRAGTQTERYFGQTEVLLDKHAWTIANSRFDSRYRTWPAGSLIPNEFGLFDMLGNVMEWCQESSLPYPDIGQDDTADDAEDLRPVAADAVRTVRGGAFLYQPSNARAGHRNNRMTPATNHVRPYVGFRVVRTWPPSGVPAAGNAAAGQR